MVFLCFNKDLAYGKIQLHLWQLVLIMKTKIGTLLEVAKVAVKDRELDNCSTNKGSYIICHNVLYLLEFGMLFTLQEKDQIFAVKSSIKNMNSLITSEFKKSKQNWVPVKESSNDWRKRHLWAVLVYKKLAQNISSRWDLRSSLFWLQDTSVKLLISCGWKQIRQ